MITFPNIAEIIPPSQVGVAVIEHYTVTEAEAKFQNMRYSLKRGGSMNYVKPGEFALLKVNGRLYMSDTQMERRTNSHITYTAHGHVLIAGLGIGMILKPLLDKPEVLSVTVIEKYQDVIDLVAPHYTDDKLRVVCADIFTWKPERGTFYDTIYFDIWPDQCIDNLDEISTLHRRGWRWKNKDNVRAYMGSWIEDELRYMRGRR